MICVLLSPLLVGCVPRQAGEVVVYCSVDREFASPILDAFERAHPEMPVARQYDIEASKTLGLATRLMAEAPRPRADVFWNGEILHTVRLQQANVLRPRRWPVPADWPKDLRASDGSWIALGARARVLLVNRQRLPDASTWPSRVLELTDARWKGQAGIAKPLFGTTATHLAVLTSRARNSTESSAAIDAWIDALATQAVVLGGNKQVAQAVARGELAWGVTDTDDAQIEIASGADVAMVYPDQGPDDAGALLIPTTLALVRGGPNPAAADALLDYLCSAKTESRLTMGQAVQFGLWPGSEQGIDAKLKRMQADFEAAATVWPDLETKLRKLFP